MEPSKDLSLKQIVEDPIMLLAFKDYCKTALAMENIDFYLAAKEFESLFQAKAGQRALSSNRLFGSMVNVRKTDDTETAAASAQSPGQGGKRVMGMSKVFGSMISMTPKSSAPMPSAAAPKASTAGADKSSDPKVMTFAMQVYKEFLTEKSQRWVCMDEHVSAAILAQIESGAVELSLFDAAIKKTFDNMEKDLVPRFNKSFNFVYTSGEQASNRGSVRFSPKTEHKRRFDTMVAKSSPLVAAPVAADAAVAKATGAVTAEPLAPQTPPLDNAPAAAEPSAEAAEATSAAPDTAAEAPALAEASSTAS